MKQKSNRIGKPAPETSPAAAGIEKPVARCFQYRSSICCPLVPGLKMDILA